jgi:hypothetical protein
MSQFYTVFISKNGNSSIELCQEYVNNTNGIEIDTGSLGFYCNVIRTIGIAHCNLNDIITNTKYDIHIYERCSIERDKILGLTLEIATNILNQLNKNKN